MNEPRFQVTFRPSGPTEFRADGEVVARCSPDNGERYEAFVDIARGLNEQATRMWRVQPAMSGHSGDGHASSIAEIICPICSPSRTSGVQK